MVYNMSAARIKRSRTHADDISDDKKRYFDPEFGKTAVKVTVGKHYVTDRTDEMIVTILGSCVSACVRDTKLGLGGLNHFMLPQSKIESICTDSDAMRYGNHAMEVLINDILKRGGARNRLEFKLFGGANLGNYSNLIGNKNARFAERYLKNEDFAIEAQDLGASYARRIRFFPTTGKVMMQALHRDSDLRVFDAEDQFQNEHKADAVEGSIDLFD
jgi:chemotaxis protein CheD